MSLQGKRIGNYTLLRLIGDGAMGEVYECIGKDGRPAAIKVMNSEFADDPVFQGRFAREAQMMASLSHPNIVPVLDHGVSEGRLYLVMKLINGPTLSKVMKQRKFSPLSAWNIIKPLTAALDFGHQQGIIHRDVKPSNVLLEQTREGTNLYLMDFGLAKVPGMGMTLTETGVAIGTPEYMSPEAAMGKDLDPRTDIYSLAIMTYELLLGIVPFDEGQAHLTAIAQVNDAPTSPVLHRLDFPKGIASVIMKSLKKLPDDRHQTIVEFAEDYYRALGNLPPDIQKKEFWVV